MLCRVFTGATRVEVAVDAAGAAHGPLSLGARVQDNGTGMSRTDMQALAQRHCTSKLQTTHQLCIGCPRTLGFRGEALASIAGTWLIIDSKCTFVCIDA